LTNAYCRELESACGIKRDEFMKDFYDFILLRMIQVLGSYSFVYRKKKSKETLKKIPKALNNIRSIREKISSEGLKTFADEVIDISERNHS
jgi:CRISPR/Cas system-associated endonuclease Cas3-HD